MTKEISRAEHLAWCKKRALEYVDSGDLNEAVASMTSDMRKHPLTDTPMLGVLAMAGVMDASTGDRARLRRWVEGFN